jgi:amino-acid N-acetyltransferase
MVVTDNRRAAFTGALCHWRRATTMRIRPATEAELPWLNDLLTSEGLPVDGVDFDRATYLVAAEEERRLGAIGLERYGSFGLLRSAIVAPPARGLGVGSDLTRAILDLARAEGLLSIFLLTTTAASFFARFGFSPIDRATAPKPIRRSKEFTSLCPATATLMRSELT